MKNKFITITILSALTFGFVNVINAQQQQQPAVAAYDCSDIHVTDGRVKWLYKFYNQLNNARDDYNLTHVLPLQKTLIALGKDPNQDPDYKLKKQTLGDIAAAEGMVRALHAENEQLANQTQIDVWYYVVNKANGYYGDPEKKAAESAFKQGKINKTEYEDFMSNELPRKYRALQLLETKRQQASDCLLVQGIISLLVQEKIEGFSLPNYVDKQALRQQIMSFIENNCPNSKNYEITNNTANLRIEVTCIN